MIVENYESGNDRKHAMGPDIIEECIAIHSMPEVDPDTWAPLFDPNAFSEAHRPLQVDDYALSHTELRQWADRCSRLRAQIQQKSTLYLERQPDVINEDETSRPRKGFKRSQPSHNVEGYTEAQLRSICQKDRKQCHKLKKRHRKDLSAAEIEKIVAATKVPFRLQKDVAHDFNITKSLVSTLVCESEKQPAKLRTKRRKDGLKLIKQEVVEEVTSSIVANG